VGVEQGAAPIPGSQSPASHTGYSREDENRRVALEQYYSPEIWEERAWSWVGGKSGWICENLEDGKSRIYCMKIFNKIFKMP
jgi:hypothetical protein